VSTFVLDTGKLIAVDRRSRDVLSTLHSAFADRDSVLVPVGVIGQAWSEPGTVAVATARARSRGNEVVVLTSDGDDLRTPVSTLKSITRIAEV